MAFSVLVYLFHTYLDFRQLKVSLVHAEITNKHVVR